MIWFDDQKLAREQHASRLRHKNNPRHKIIIPSDATEKELSHAIAVTPPPKRKKKPYKKRKPRKIPTKQLDFSKVARFAAMRVEGAPKPGVSQSPENSLQINNSNERPKAEYDNHKNTPFQVYADLCRENLKKSG